MKTYRGCIALAFICLCILFAGCGGGSGNAAEPLAEPVVRPTLELALNPATATLGGDSELTIEMSDIDGGVFALALRVDYDPALVGIDEAMAFTPGDFLGPEALVLFQVEAGVIHVSMTETASGAKTLRNGIVGTVMLEALNAGNCDFTVSVDELRFIDAGGDGMTIEDLEIAGTSLIIQ